MAGRRRALLLVPALAGLLAVVLLLRTDHDYTLVAEFGNASGLRKDYSVRVGGVTVGHVRDLDVTRDDHVRATLAIDRDAAPVGRDATAAIRAANLFGEKFVDIRPGDTRTPAPSGAVIPIARTKTPVEIDEVLDVLDTDTRARLASLLNEAGTALAGRGPEFRTVLGVLPGTLGETHRLVGAFAADNRALGQLVERSDRVMGTLAPKRVELGDLVDRADGAVSSFVVDHRALARSVEQSPPALDELRRTLGRIRALSPPLASASDALRQTAAPLDATLRALPGFARSARPALSAARSAAPVTTTLARELTPLLRRLGPASAGLERFASSFAPFSRLLATATPDLLGLMEAWVRVTQVRDGVGHMFRNSITLGPGTLETLIGPASPPARGRRPHHRHRPDPAPAPRPESPAPKRPGPTLPRLPDLPQVKLPEVKVPPVATPPPVSDVLDYLFGK